MNFETISDSIFVLRIFLTVNTGILLLCLMHTLAIRNPQTDQISNEEGNKISIIKQFLYIVTIISCTIFGYLFFINEETKRDIKYNKLIKKSIGVFCLISCIVIVLTDIFTLPNYPNFYRIEWDGIVRHSYQHLVWGYLSPTQFFISRAVTDFFIWLSLAIYAFCFKPSQTKWYTKFRKVIGVTLCIALYQRFWEFHYFDSYEFIPHLVLGGLSFICLKDYNIFKRKKNIEPDTSCNPQPEKESGSLPYIVTDAHELTSEQDLIQDEIKDDNQKETSEELYTNEINETNTDILTLDYMYCKYCGKQIESDSIFCKHCGRNIGRERVAILHKPNKMIACIKNIGSFLCSKYKQFVDSKTIRVLVLSIIFISFISSIVAVILSLMVRNFDKGAYFDIIKHVHGFGPDFGPYDLATLKEVIIALITFTLLIIWIRIKISKKSRVISSIPIILCLITISIPLFRDDFLYIYKSFPELQKVKEVNKNWADPNVRETHFKEIWGKYVKDVNSRIDYRRLYNKLSCNEPFIKAIREDVQLKKPYASQMLGEFYLAKYFYDEESGKGSSLELHTAYKYIEKSALEGDARGQYLMGRFYAEDYPMIEKDLAIAYEWWTKAADQNYASAHYSLGNLFGTWKFLEGVKTLAVGAGSGVLVGYDENGRRTFKLPKDFSHNVKKAREHWQKAADLGCKEAEEALSLIYFDE